MNNLLDVSEEFTLDDLDHTKLSAIITVGIPASGKSTWAKEFCKENGYKEINRDNIRMDIFELKHYNDYNFSKSKESQVSEVVKSKIASCVEKSQNIVISDTNLNKTHRENLIVNLEALGYDVYIKLFYIEYFDAIKRSEKRTDKSIPRKVMYDMYRRYVEYMEELGFWEKYEPNTTLKSAYIVDIDGTIADMTGIRKPYEFQKVDLDKPIWLVIDVIKTLSSQGNKIIILSGRDESCRELTEQWLMDYSINYDELYMRPEGSKTKDRYVKLRLFEDYIENRFNVLGVFDDRPQVALLWYDLGLTLFKVGDPIREF